MAKTQDGNNGKPAKRAQMKTRESLKNIRKNFTTEQAILADISYHIGRISRRTVDRLKESMDTDTCKKIGKDIGAFCNHIENGWGSPDKIFEKNGLVIKDTSSLGKIMGSCAKNGTDLLNKTCKVASGYLGKAYKLGRMATLIAVWKIENPKASKAKEQGAVSAIKKLFKS